MTDRNASLVLKTSDFTTDTNYIYGRDFNSTKGTCNRQLSLMTWNNINLRTLLGDMYNDFDLFNLCLNSITTANANQIDTSSDVRNISVKISGLPFINQTYNIKNGCNGVQTMIATFNFIPNQCTTQYYYSNNIATFGKNQELCNITIEYDKILDDTLALPISITKTCNTTNTNGVISMADTSSLFVGMYVYGPGILPNTYIVSINQNVSVVVNNNSTLNQTGISIPFTSNFPNTVFVFDIFGIKKN
jgi:hypothetical protein